MKLRSFPQRFRHQIIGDFEPFQNGEWAFHNGLRELAMDPVGDRRNQLQGSLHVFGFDRVGLGLSRGQPGRSGQEVEKARHPLARSSQQIEGRGFEDGSIQADLPQTVKQVRFDLSGLESAQSEVSRDP